MSLIFIVTERHERFSEQQPPARIEPTGVYALRILTELPTEKVINRLMVAMCRQIKERYVGMENLTPATMAATLDVSVYSGTPTMKTWPEHLGYVYRDRYARQWSW